MPSGSNARRANIYREPIDAQGLGIKSHKLPHIIRRPTEASLQPLYMIT
jgi:hypothetical protein